MRTRMRRTDGQWQRFGRMGMLHLVLASALALLVTGCSPTGGQSAAASDEMLWPSQYDITIAPDERVELRFRTCSESIRVSKIDDGPGTLRIERWMVGDAGPLPDLVVWRTEAWTIQALDRVERWVVRGEGAEPSVLRIDGSGADLLHAVIRESP